MNLKQQDTQHLFYKAVSNLVRRELTLFFCLTSNWYGLNCYKLGVLNLVMACSQKKKLDILLFKKTDEEIYIDCLFHRRKVLHGKWMVGMYLLSTQSASYDLMCCVTL